MGLGPGHNTGHAVTMSMIAALLEGAVGRNVFDRTGLAGKFDVDLQWTPSIFTAVREQLGLKLEWTRGPVDILVIDHAEQPAAN
jgi:uncharacterized protein (TIGR03435 family)